MKRTEIINLLIQKYGYKSYLEVGTQDPRSNFNSVDTERKVSIDPFPRGEVTFVGTSDEYFSSISDEIKFDIIFIDGLHHDDQVLRDIENSLKHLSEKGTIVCHDCLPTTELMQARDDHGGEWTGDVWKAIAQLRVERTDLDIKVVDTDYGCGIIQKGKSVPYKPLLDFYKTYTYFSSNKKEMLNVISLESFLQWIDTV
jgi:hypothetical protein